MCISFILPSIRLNFKIFVHIVFTYKRYAVRPGKWKLRWNETSPLKLSLDFFGNDLIIRTQYNILYTRPTRTFILSFYSHSCAGSNLNVHGEHPFMHTWVHTKKTITRRKTCLMLIYNPSFHIPATQFQLLFSFHYDVRVFSLYSLSFSLYRDDFLFPTFTVIYTYVQFICNSQMHVETEEKTRLVFSCVQRGTGCGFYGTSNWTTIRFTDYWNKQKLLEWCSVLFIKTWLGLND